MAQPMGQGGMARNAAPQPYMTADQQQALQYQAYLQQQQQQQAQGGYPMPPQQGGQAPQQGVQPQQQR